MTDDAGDSASDTVSITVDPAPSGRENPLNCTGTGGGRSRLRLEEVDIEFVTFFELIVSRGLPNAPLSVDGQTLACLDDRGNYDGMIEGVWLEDCEVVIDDTVKFITTPVEDCVAWRDTHVPTLVGADLLHQEGITGAGVNIAVVDTGVQGPGEWGENAFETVARYNVFNGEASGGDASGHGSHVASVATSHGVTAEGDYNGIAPGAGLVGVKAFDGGMDRVPTSMLSPASIGWWPTRTSTTSAS